MELKVWVEGIPRVVCGVGEATTCHDVILALAHAIGKTGRFTLIEKWRETEHLLAPDESPIKALTKWGEYAPDVQFLLKYSEQSSTNQRTRYNRNKQQKRLKPVPDYLMRRPRYGGANIKRNLTFNGALNPKNVNHGKGASTSSHENSSLESLEEQSSFTSPSSTTSSPYASLDKHLPYNPSSLSHHRSVPYNGDCNNSCSMITSINNNDDSKAFQYSPSTSSGTSTSQEDSTTENRIGTTTNCSPNVYNMRKPLPTTNTFSPAKKISPKFNALQDLQNAPNIDTPPPSLPSSQNNSFKSNSFSTNIKPNGIELSNTSRLKSNNSPKPVLLTSPNNSFLYNRSKFAKDNNELIRKPLRTDSLSSTSSITSLNPAEMLRNNNNNHLKIPKQSHYNNNNSNAVKKPVVTRKLSNSQANSTQENNDSHIDHLDGPKKDDRNDIVDDAQGYSERLVEVTKEELIRLVTSQQDKLHVQEQRMQELSQEITEQEKLLPSSDSSDIGPDDIKDLELTNNNLDHELEDLGEPELLEKTLEEQKEQQEKLSEELDLTRRRLQQCEHELNDRNDLCESLDEEVESYFKSVEDEKRKQKEEQEADLRQKIDELRRDMDAKLKAFSEQEEKIKNLDKESKKVIEELNERSKEREELENELRDVNLAVFATTPTKEDVLEEKDNTLNSSKRPGSARKIYYSPAALKEAISISSNDTTYWV